MKRVLIILENSEMGFIIQRKYISLYFSV